MITSLFQRDLPIFYRTHRATSLLFKVSIKTLQRYRAIGALPYFTISGKVYYKASDVREFIKERFSVTTLRQFEKEHCTKKKK